MLNRFLNTSILFLIILFTSACQDTRSLVKSPDPRPAYQPRMSIDQLAKRLNLVLAKTTSTHVVLRDPVNRVFIFEDPDGRVFVNGVQVGPEGGIKRIEGILYVPETMEGVIRNALKIPSKPFHDPERLPPRRVVVIDPGHGGKDPGAVSVLGFFEKALNLAVANELASLLRKRNMEVILTRDRDRFIELEERAEIANASDADLFVSIHADSFSDGSVQGFTIYTRRSPRRESILAAKFIEKVLSETDLPSRGVRQEDYRVLLRAKCPALLVELGFLSNINEAALLADQGFQERLARSLADGIVRFFETYNMTL